MARKPSRSPPPKRARTDDEEDLSCEEEITMLKVSFDVSKLLRQLDHMKAMKEKMDKQAKQGPPDQATMEAARKELDQKIMALLTAEQKTKYTKFMESHKPPKRGGAGGPGGPGGPPQH
jgi:hypothetical protein